MTDYDLIEKYQTMRDAIEEGVYNALYRIIDRMLTIGAISYLLILGIRLLVWWYK